MFSLDAVHLRAGHVLERMAPYRRAFRGAQTAAQSNTLFEIVMFLNPPFDSVPNLIRP
jgi:hypothetical protein